MHGHQRDVKEELADEIAVGDGVKGVRADGCEPEIVRKGLPINPKRVARKRPGAQRHAGCAAHRINEAVVVALQGRGVAEQPVRPPNRLGRLKVRVPGHQDPALRLGPAHARRDELPQQRAQMRHFAQQPQAHVRGDLVVAGTARVELPGNRGANQIGQNPLVCRVDVLVALENLKSERLD